MSKYFKEWKKQHERYFIIEQGTEWQACKAKVLELLKAEARTPIEKKKRTWDEVLEDL